MHLPLDSAVIRLFLRLLFGLILLSAGVSKFVHLRQFRLSLQDYHLIPSKLEARLPILMILSFIISIAEFLIGLGLFIGFWLVLSVVLAISLFVVFNGAIAINLLRGRRDLSCHCGGVVGDHMISWWLVGRNILFVGSLLLILFTPPDVFTIVTALHDPSMLLGKLWGIFLPTAMLVGETLTLFMLFKVTHLFWSSKERSRGSKQKSIGMSLIRRG